MAHKCIVAKVSEVVAIPGADRIHVAKVLGEDCIVSKEVGVGFEGLLFPADLQLSEDFCHENNLNRSSELNKDKEKKGFFEKSRRVRVQPFLKVKSTAFFCGKESVAFTGVNIDELKLGVQFDELNGKKICQKYVSEETKVAKGNKQTQQAKKNYAPLFEKHVDSEQFKHYAHTIPKGALLSFHSKKHGTSFRVAHTKVGVELPKWKQLVNKVVDVFPSEKWDYVVGTRNVILKPQDSSKEGFHGSEAFRFEVMEQLKSYLEKGISIYGEIVGFVNDKPIMPRHSTDALKDKKFSNKYGKEITYTYGCKEHEYKFHVYRITYLNHNNENVDFSQKQLEKWCQERNIPYTLEVYPQMVYDGNVSDLCNLVEQLTERPDVLTEDYTDPSHISEGIILRIDDGGLTPKFMKSKSYAFRVAEGICKEVDTEDAS